MAEMDITEDVRVGQDMKEGQLPVFTSNKTSECGNPISLDSNPEQDPQWYSYM
jgi:hypothetical protein